MEDEFIKKFVGKTVRISNFGVNANDDGITGVLVSVRNGILHLADGNMHAYLDIDGIYCVALEGEI